MPYRVGANLGVAKRSQQERRYSKLKLKNKMPYGSMAGRRLGKEYGKMKCD